MVGDRPFCASVSLSCKKKLNKNISGQVKSGGELLFDARGEDALGRPAPPVGMGNGHHVDARWFLIWMVPSTRFELVTYRV